MACSDAQALYLYIRPSILFTLQLLAHAHPPVQLSCIYILSTTVLKIRPLFMDSHFLHVHTHNKQNTSFVKRSEPNFNQPLCKDVRLAVLLLGEPVLSTLVEDMSASV